MKSVGLLLLVAAFGAALAGCAATRPGNACLANSFGIRDAPATIGSDARRVCRALHSQGAARSDPFDAAEMRALLKPATNAARVPARVVFYTGHGEPAGRDKGGLEFIAADRHVPATEFLAAVTARVPSEPARARPTVLVINSCDSGFLILPKGPPISFLGSGYGGVDRRPVGRFVGSAFGHYLVQGLEGRADLPPVGNCDGIVTDEEIAQYVRAALHHDRNGSAANWEQLENWPTLVLKRNTNLVLPVTRTAARFGCARRPLPASLPAELREPAQVYAQMLDGGGTQPPVPARYLVLAGGPNGSTFPDALVKRLRELSTRLGWVLIDGGPKAEPELDASLQAVSFLDAVLLWMKTRADSSTYVELRSPRERAALWAWSGAFPSSQAEIALATEIARRLPRRVDLFRVHGLAPLVLRVLGPVPEHLALLPWRDFAGGHGAGRELSTKTLDLSPCPGAEGHCYLVDPTLVRGEEEPWIVVPRR